MNFTELYKRIHAIQEGEDMQPVAPVATDAPADVAECGMEMMPRPSMPPKQQDNVTMNVSMNGSGAGGIRDLMGILKSIESSGNSNPHPHNADALFGAGESDLGAEVFGDMEEEQGDGGFGSATTAPSTVTHGIDAVTPTGDDMHSKGAERPKVNGGGNPMQEAIASKLHQLYQEIKTQ